MKLTLAVLTYNNKSAFEACMEAISQQEIDSAIDFEVLVVFNGSPYADQGEYLNPRYRKILLSQNVGNVVGQNLCFKYAHGDYVLFVSDDVVVGKHFVTNMVHSAQSIEGAHRRIGQVMPVVYRPDGNVDTCGLELRWPCYGVSRKEPGWLYVQAVPSITYLMKKSVWEDIGGFDEAYPMAYEDVDMGWRLTQAGYHNGVAAIASVTHLGNATLRYGRKDRWRFHKARLRFISKHFSGMDRWARTNAVKVIDAITRASAGSSSASGVLRSTPSQGCD